MEWERQPPGWLGAGPALAAPAVRTRATCTASVAGTAAAGCSVIDWLQVQESQRQLLEAVGGGALAPQRLEERLDRAHANWHQQQELLWGAPD